MGRKKPHPEHENLERWLVSYADFITLLFATFTALYALAQAELTDLHDVSKAIREGFAQQSSIMQGIASIFQGESTPTDKPNPLFEETGRGDGVIGRFESLTYMSGEIKAVEELLEKLRDELKGVNGEINQLNQVKGLYSGTTPVASEGYPPKEAIEGDAPMRGVEVSLQERGLKVSFDSRLLFKPGSAQLQKQSIRLLGKIAQRLKPYSKNHLIHVEGHTDSQPIASKQFPSNWELSTARASTVVRQLIRGHGFSPKYMAAVGYAASRPVAKNDTAKGRAQNRRIDLIIYSKVQGLKNDPSKQARGDQKIIKSPDAPKRPASRSTGQSGASASPGTVKTQPVNAKLLRSDSEGY